MCGEVVVAVEGCCHGELDSIYETIAQAESLGSPKVELLIVCGDFQSVRDIVDLQCLAVPEKYRAMNSFHRYFSGESLAPVLTIFIGGNHEASNALQSLYYGGWICQNIYFLGFAGVVNYKGLRIGGISGIFNHRHYHLGHYERTPYTNQDLYSVYHLRELEIYRMAHLQTRVEQTPLDIFISHDWPGGIWNYGDSRRLVMRKPYLEEDMRTNKLGSPPLMALLKLLKPTYWFAAHLHVKFSAIVPHLIDEFSQSSVANLSSKTTQCITISEKGEKNTKFLSLDKCMPGREFLQILNIPCSRSSQIDDASLSTVSPSFLQYDMEWLAILKRTHHLLTVHRGVIEIPRELDPPSDENIREIQEIFSTFSFGRNIPPTDHGSKERRDENHSTSDVGDTNEVLNMLGLNHYWMEGCSYKMNIVSNKQTQPPSLPPLSLATGFPEITPSTDPCEVYVDEAELS